MKTRLPFLLLALVLVAALAACGGGGNSGPVPTDSIAQVGSTPITKATFNGLMAVAFARYKAQGVWAADPLLSEEGFARLRRAMLGSGFLRREVPFAECTDNTLAAAATAAD